MDFNSTVKGSALEGFYPEGWDFEKIDACIGEPETVCERQSFWNEGFTPVQCDSLDAFETYMGHEIAMQIKKAKDRNEKIAFILPVVLYARYKGKDFEYQNDLLNKLYAMCKRKYFMQ